ncbi:MAG: DUF308 domain-containing protein, partial [Bacteroidota bacterium]|nr:DUF308 domain-containing protein [Bacteroidota bacterium]
MNQEVISDRKSQYWWVPLLFGFAFIGIGYWILRSPEESFEKITKFIGAIILVSGTVQLIFTLMHRRGIPGWGFQLAGDLFDLAVGLALLFNPSLLLKLITLFVGIWLIANSISIFMRAAESRKDQHPYWRWEFALGIFLMVLAAMFLWHPMLLGISIAIWTALAFIILGIFRIVLTFRLRRMGMRQAP